MLAGIIWELKLICTKNSSNNFATESYSSLTGERKMLWRMTIILSISVIFAMQSLRKKSPYSEFFWSVFSHICTEYEEILRIQSKCGKIWDTFTQWIKSYELVWELLLKHKLKLIFQLTSFTCYHSVIYRIMSNIY